MSETVKSAVEKFGNNATRLIDILHQIQAEDGYISDDSVNELSDLLNISTVDIEQTLSFYHFFNRTPNGKYNIHLNNSAVANMMGRAQVANYLTKELECNFGQVTSDGLIGLYETACIGMSDQEPAAIINGKIFTCLTPEKMKNIINNMKAGKDINEMTESSGDGMNSSELIKSMVNNNIHRKGEVILSDFESGTAIKKMATFNPEEIVKIVKNANLRGRGGAGFPTGMKWEFCRKSAETPRYVICNADEGEPGTFKDRVILTECPHLLFEGMVIAGYAIEAKESILYLRNEYRYLEQYLENVLADMRNNNLLGTNICGKDNFSYDIRIQFGAGAYICGEESALIESVEGKRGEPRNRPPFPVEKGYLDKPTVVNNVETLCAAARIIINGPEWFKNIGIINSSGTKLLSVSGDCDKPGIYEIPWGLTVNELLNMVEAKSTKAVQIGGPSGICVGEKDFNKKISFDDLATGGSIIIMNKDRNLLEIVDNFMDFFIDESCGSCVPCRALTVVLKKKLEKVMHGNGTQKDLEEMEQWGSMMKMANRCGLGQTAANPILSTLKSFKQDYQNLIKSEEDYVSEFDLAQAVAESCEVAGRTPNL